MVWQIKNKWYNIKPKKEAISSLLLETIWQIRKRKTNIDKIMLVFNHPINFTKNNQKGWYYKYQNRYFIRPNSHIILISTHKVGWIP